MVFYYRRDRTQSVFFSQFPFQFQPISAFTLLICSLILLSITDKMPTSTALHLIHHPSTSISTSSPSLSSTLSSHLQKDFSNSNINNSSTTTNYPFRILYANGLSEETLPECGRASVCNKVDIYDKPWIEKQCRCPSYSQPCSMSILPNDGHTIIDYDKSRQYKLCEPARKYPKCRRYFRDITWNLVTKGGNLTEQIVHCRCPKDSAYMIKRQPYSIDDNEIGFKYSFACSPKSRVVCQRKEPCRLFTVKRRSNLTEVNMSSLCNCPDSFHCPSHHRENGVIPGKFYPENLLRIYSGYCI